MPYGVVLASYICQNIPLIYGAEFIIKGTPSRLLMDELEKKFTIFKYIPITKIVAPIAMKYLSLLERIACSKVDHIIAISELDKERLINLHCIDKDKITVVPYYINSNELINKTISTDDKPKDKDSITVVFHGSYVSHPANYEAFKLVIDYIAPEIEKRTSNIRFLIGGTNLPKFEKGNLKSLGFIEDLHTFLQSADIAIVPFISGSGVKIKIFDYMSVGLPVVTTKNGIEGIKAENGKHVVVVDTVNQNFIDAILDLSRNTKKRDILGRNVLELVRTKYSSEVAQARMDEMLVRVNQVKD